MASDTPPGPGLPPAESPPPAYATPGPTVSPDGRFYWDGGRWVPIGAPAGGYLVAPRNPALGVLLSFFFPGVGSLVNGRTTNGVIILVGWLISIPLMFVCVGFFTYAGFWIWGMFDAYYAAQDWNRAHGIIS